MTIDVQEIFDHYDIVLNALRDARKIAAQQAKDEALRTMVDRFLGWQLPKDFAPDAGVLFIPKGWPSQWPTGRNLFTAEQATAMFKHCVSLTEEQPDQHPLEGLHINKGSLNAASDAYEAEYNAAIRARAQEKAP